MLTLQLAGLGDDPACAHGRAFLMDRQHDGTWDEPEHTGTGFPGDFYINYHLYRHVFPTLALAAGEPQESEERVTERELVANR
jgi:squalene-hopene/tetraprenyl-beta-curcumene cyclase